MKKTILATAAMMFAFPIMSAPDQSTSTTTPPSKEIYDQVQDQKMEGPVLNEDDEAEESEDDEFMPPSQLEDPEEDEEYL